MTYRMSEDQNAVVLSPQATASASVIWLHGLGADGHDFVPLVQQLRLPPSVRARFIFPHAPVRAVTLNQGYRMRAWYDIIGLAADSPEDGTGIGESAALVNDLIGRERAADIAANRIVIAGFSQGGAIALHTALRCVETLGGVLALSTYLPLRDRLEAEASDANRNIPILMCHGSQDTVVGLALGERSRDALLQLHYPVRWIAYPMRHEVCHAEIHDISLWLAGILA